ncbi:uncharacterized protein EDB91DRAFT_624982 [Suillus paluster]|uniref:uncharacterized protein n=1 Tax=Suillus paluster TaxID=48578 RepID=UPI001B872912|nr:uncharacterized protein EDB91DRAFT_624982 [Suillus paluster]KAG1733868.1 hypothetical protein EDB91DRAFT_624982 [Suillus paluster]
MLRLLYITLSLLLCLQLAVADPASTVLRISRHSKTSSIVTKSVLSALLVRRGRFTARAGSDGCASGYQQCTNYPDTCAPVGNNCCNDLYSCPSDSFCFDSGCCPNDAQTCNGSSCCDPDSVCCNDSTGGCCPNGSTCIANSNECSTEGSSGGGSGGGSGGSSVTTATATATATSKSTSTVLHGTTSTSSSAISSNSPTTTTSSSTHSVASSTVSSGGSSATGSSVPVSIGAAPRGFVSTNGKQLAALAVVVCLPILHNVAHIL